MVDVTGIAVVAVVGAAIAAVGAGVDSLLLERHVKWFNAKSILWWDYFDNLKLFDIPRQGIVIFLKFKRILLGEKINIRFAIRTGIVSIILTIFAVFGGTAFSLQYYELCEGTQFADSLLSTAWDLSGGFYNIYHLILINLIFDSATVLATAWLMTVAVTRNDHELGGLVFIDVLICILLFEALMLFTDEYRNIRHAYEGYGTAISNMYTALLNTNCATVLIVAPSLAYSATIIVPTAIYLVLIFVLFVLRETFNILKWFAMHILEKSSEDTKKTIFAHIGASIGILVTVAKAFVELFKTLNGI